MRGVRLLSLGQVPDGAVLVRGASAVRRLCLVSSRHVLAGGGRLRDHWGEQVRPVHPVHVLAVPGQRLQRHARHGVRRVQLGVRPWGVHNVQVRGRVWGLRHPVQPLHDVSARVVCPLCMRKLRLLLHFLSRLPMLRVQRLPRRAVSGRTVSRPGDDNINDGSVAVCGPEQRTKADQCQLPPDRLWFIRTVLPYSLMDLHSAHHQHRRARHQHGAGDRMHPVHVLAVQGLGLQRDARHRVQRVHVIMPHWDVYDTRLLQRIWNHRHSMSKLHCVW